MSNVVGQLTIDMVANVARLQRDMEQAKRSVGGAMGSIQKTVDLAKKALIGLGGVLAVRKFASFIQGAIDSADQMSKLSQRIGVSVKDVAGLQLAFRQSGIEAGALQTSMARLALGIANGNRALTTMGVVTRNVDGTLKTTRQVLGDVANQFASYQDGAAKSALAIELFGKAGADMIPLLNGGAEALDNFDAMAMKLGLTLDKETAQAAERFNDTLDLVSAATEGMATKISAQLLPTLEAMADAFFTVTTESTLLQTVADAIRVVFQTLTVVGSDLVFVLVQIGKGFVAVGEAAAQALTGNFRAAGEVFAEYNRQAQESRAALDRFQATVMGAGSATVAAMAATRSAVKDTAPVFTQLETAAKRQAEAQRLMNKELDDYFKAEEKARTEKEQAIGTAREMVEQIEFETEALRMTNTEREIAIKLRELERRGIREGSREYEEFSKRVREAVIGRETERAAIETQRRTQEAWAKTWEQVAQSFTDALMQGGKSVKEYLISLFRTMILRPTLLPIVGAVGGMLGMPAMAGEAGAGLGGTMNVLTMAKNAYDMIAGGFTSLGSSVAFAADTMGAWLVNNTSGILNQMGGSLMQSAGSLGTAASYFAGAASGMALGSIISGQYAAFGNANVSNVAGTAIGAMLGGPLGAAIGGAIGGIVNRAFGMGSPTVTNQGIGGYLQAFGGAGQANIKSFADMSQSGGWFRSDRAWRDWQNLSMEVIDQFNQATSAIYQSARQMATALGQTQASFANFEMYFEAAGSQMEQVITNFSDALVRFYFPAVADFVREGETSYEALQRLSTAAGTFNQVFDTLGHTMRANTLATADMADRLIELFGSSEQFVQSTSTYYRDFYTEAERAAITTRQLSVVLASMNLQLPATREGFRALVEAQDLTTEAGRQTYAALINLAPAFASVTQAVSSLQARADQLAETARQMEQAYREAQTQTDAAFNAVRRAIDAQMRIASTARDVANETISTLTNVFDILKSNIEDLYGLGGAAMTAAQGRAFIEQAILTAQTTGYLPDAQELRQAIGAARGGSNFATSFEMQRDQLVLAGRLEVLRDLTGTQLTTAEQQLAAADEQITLLQSQLQSAEDQLNALRGIDTSVMSVAAAIRQLASAIGAETGALGGAQTAQQRAQSAATQAQQEAQREMQQQQQLAAQQAAEQAATQARQAKEQKVHNLLQQLYSSGGYSIAIDESLGHYQEWVNWAMQRGAQSTINHWKSLGLRGDAVATFAAGGLHGGGMRMVGETGPELEVTGPARYFSASQTANMMGGGAEVAMEIRGLREENKAQARALVGLQSRMTRLLERWDGDGIPEERTVSA